MSVRSGQSITADFVTSRFDTGAATAADSLPTGTLVVNGTDDAATVTVTSKTGGKYKAAVTLPTLAVGDVVQIRIAATVNSVAGIGVIWTDQKDLVIDSAGLTDANMVKAGPTGSGTAQTAGDLAALITTVDDLLDTEIADIQARLPAALTADGNIKADALRISGDATAADNAELFFDGTGYNAANSTVGTVTTTTTATTVTTVNGLAAGVITAASIATGAIDADALAADAGTELGTAVWASATRTLTSLSGLTVDTVTTLTNLPAITANWLTAAGTAADFGTEVGTAVWATTTRVLTAGTNVDGSTFTAIPWNAAWDAEVQSEVDDALVGQRLDELLNADSDIDGAAPPTVGSVFHELMSKTAGSFTFDQTTDSNEAIRDRGDAAWTTATGFSTHTAADVWSSGTRTLTAGTNIQLPSNGLANVTAWTVNVTGSLSGSVGSVTGAVGSVTGNVGGNVVGSVASVTAAVTLTSAYDFAKGTAAMTEAYRSAGGAPTPIQALYEILENIVEFSLSGTTKTVKKVDGSTTAKTYTLDSSSSPTSITETT